MNQLNEDEFYDVYRVFRPGATREEFSREWEEFQRFKAEYLENSSFSRSGLIEQLKFEGFTTAQATYGVKKAGL